MCTYRDTLLFVLREKSHCVADGEIRGKGIDMLVRERKKKKNSAGQKQRAIRRSVQRACRVARLFYCVILSHEIHIIRIVRVLRTIRALLSLT